MGVATDTRARMVSSAALLLREHGVSGTSFAKVLEHSGGPRGSIGFHFPGGKTELVTDALRLIGGQVSSRIRSAGERGATPAQVVGGFATYYRDQLIETEFAAGCPVWAVAHEAHDHPDLRAEAEAVLGDWHAALVDVMTAHGHHATDAHDLAWLSVSSIEGAITLSRVQRSSAPLDAVSRRLDHLLD